MMHGHTNLKLAQLFLELAMFQTKKGAEEIKTHILCPATFLQTIVLFFKITWKNTENRGGPQMTI
jgi:hypothetical protein